MEDKIKQVIAECESRGVAKFYLIPQQSTYFRKDSGGGWNLHILGTEYSIEEESPTIVEIAHRLLSLGVQSPALDEKDENGLLPCPFCGGKATVSGEALCVMIACKTCDIGKADVGYGIFKILQPWWNTRAHAPSAVKDPEIDRLKSQGDEFIAQRDHLLAKLRLEREKAEKLIEALEEIVYTYNNCGDLKNLTGVNHIGAVAKQSLATYKGKEGGDA